MATFVAGYCLLPRHLPFCKPFCKPFAQQCRSYALSRFSHRTTGFGRTSRNNVLRRPQIDPPSGSEDRLWTSSGYGEHTSEDPSQHWRRSVDPTADPEVGLKRLLAHDELVVTRQLEMLNVFVGFEQSNRYVITDPTGKSLGYIVEESRGLFSMLSRQVFRTHRPFRALVMDIEGLPVLWIRRPFSWINSRMFVQRPIDHTTRTPRGQLVLDTFSEVQQEWHLWKRRYNLFLRLFNNLLATLGGATFIPLNVRSWKCPFLSSVIWGATWSMSWDCVLSTLTGSTPHRAVNILSSDPQPEVTTPEIHFNQFARVDEGLWAWLFVLRDAQGEGIASVNRAFRGFGREVFTDTGQYTVSFRAPDEQIHSSSENNRLILHRQDMVKSLSVDERALVLAMAINIDYDYFSRHSEGGGFGLWWTSGE